MIRMRRMRVLALISSSLARSAALVALSMSAHAQDFHTRQPLWQSVAAANVVVHARVLATAKQLAPEGSSRGYCGTNYEMEVLATFKGDLRQRFTLSAYGSWISLPFYEVAVGDELLLLLTQAEGNNFPNSGVARDVIHKPLSPAQQLACSRKLSKWKLSRTNESGFLLVPRKSSSGEQSLWFAFVGSRTLVPPVAAAKEIPFDEACEGEPCREVVRRMVPWPLVEGEIRRWLSETKPRGSDTPKPVPPRR
jgi:hypothetical protein